MARKRRGREQSECSGRRAAESLGARAVITIPGHGIRFGLEVAEHPAERSGLPCRVVVLPFASFGMDASLGWLADSIVEDITTELSRFRDLFVVSRNSAFMYRDRALDLRAVSRQLGTRYVVEGSIRATSRRLRVTAQLIDARSGGHVWAENFDTVPDAHNEAQDSIIRAIVTSLVPQIDRAEMARTITPGG